jgi:hypothetical protein
MHCTAHQRYQTHYIIGIRIDLSFNVVIGYLINNRSVVVELANIKRHTTNAYSVYNIS